MQYPYLGEGPCVEATRTPGMGLTFSGDLAQGAVPGLRPRRGRTGRAQRARRRSVPRGRSRRRFNVYAFEAGGLDEVDRDVAVIAHASTALAGTVTATTARLETTQLRQALQSRDVIGGKGILMERRGISADEAFNVLRRA